MVDEEGDKGEGGQNSWALPDLRERSLPACAFSRKMARGRVAE